MTVWAASMPVRVQLLEKGAFRIIGTIVGALFGIALLILAGDHTWITVIGLALWIGLCAGTGNLVRGFASYGAMLAGYSAAMVALLHSARSMDPLAVGIDRMLTVLLGVLIAIVCGWLFSAASRTEDLLTRMDALSARIVDALAASLTETAMIGASAEARTSASRRHELLSAIAAIEEKLDQQAIGTPKSRDIRHAMRRVLLNQVALVLWARTRQEATDDLALTPRLTEALSRWSDPARRSAALQQAAAQAATDPILADALRGLCHPSDMGQRTGEEALFTPRDHGLRQDLRRARHRDWTGAREAALRAMFVILAVGMAVLGSGWEGGPYTLLGTAIMLTIFSTAENPAPVVRQVLLGQTLGVLAATLCRWAVWPFAGNEQQMVLTIMPFVLAGGILFGHRRTSGPIGYDFNMVLLLLLQPGWPLSGSLSHSAMIGVAVILGTATGLAAFSLIFPTSGRKRLRMLTKAMIGEIEMMAARPGISRKRLMLRARFYHRVVHLIRWIDKTGGNGEDAINGARALMLAGSALLHLDERQSVSQVEPRLGRGIDLVRARLHRLRDDPAAAAWSLRLAAARLAGRPDGDAALLQEAAAALEANARFIEANSPAT
jgi:uncharacterized membrane protein YccC